MKKPWPFVIIILFALAGGAIFLLQNRSPGIPEAGPPVRTDKSVIYQFSIAVRQKTGSEPESTLIAADGLLHQFIQKATPREYVTEWTELKTLTVMNRAAEPEMAQGLLQKLIVSSLENEDGYVHYFGKDFPQELIAFQVSVLQRILIPFPIADKIPASPLSRSEGDEIGVAKVRYDLQKSANGFNAVKTWIRYDQEGIKVDEHNRSITYVLAADERPISAKGRIILHYRQTNPARYTIELSMRAVSEQDKAIGRLPPARESMQRVGRTELAQAVSKADNRSAFSYQEAMQKLDAVTEDTASNEVYAIFSSLKDEINKEPARSTEVIQKILSTKDRDPAAERRLTVLFGALSQTNEPQISTQLSGMVEQCPDSFCKVQAAAAVNTHPNPTEDAALEMLRIGDNANDPDVASTALLAAGAVGRRLEGRFEDLPKHLLNDLSDPKKEFIKTSVLAAMGNHGDGDYLAALQAYSVSKDPSLRAAAIYSLRYLPQESIHDILVAATGDKDAQVVREAYKALEYRDLPIEAYQALAKQAASHSDPELQQLAARIFVQTYREDPNKVELAINAFKSATSLGDIKQYLEGEIEKIDQEAREAERQFIEN